MPSSPRFPAYPSKPHKSGQARIRFRRKDYYLGNFGSNESRLEYARLAREYAQRPDIPLPPKAKVGVVTIRELIALWASDNTGREAEQVIGAAKPLERLFGAEYAADFDDEKLETLRTAMISCSWMNEAEHADRKKRQKLPGWSRNHVRHQISRVRRIFRWAERKKLVPKGTWENLRTLPPMKKGEARKNPTRKAVADDIIQKTKPHMPLMVQAMVTVQLAAAMRPSELCRMTPKLVKQEGDVWIYSLTEFKTDYLEDSEEWQIVPLGPVAQSAIKPWLDAAAAIGPDTAVWQYGLSNPQPMTTGAYYQAIEAACKRAGVKQWCPYQIRHSAKRRAERLEDVHAAKAFLRHRTVESTKQYASQQDVEKAKEIAREIG